MERKALVIFVLLLSALSLLVVLNYNQQAPATVPSPTVGPSPAGNATVKPYVAAAETAGNITQNATVTPAPKPAPVKYSQQPAPSPTPTPLPQMTPTAMAPWAPMKAWEPMDAWGPAEPMTPWAAMPTMAPASPLS